MSPCSSEFEAVLQVDSVKYDTSKVVMAKRIYVVHSHVKYGYRCATENPTKFDISACIVFWLHMQKIICQALYHQ